MTFGDFDIVQNNVASIRNHTEERHERAVRSADETAILGHGNGRLQDAHLARERDEEVLREHGAVLAVMVINAAALSHIRTHRTVVRLDLVHGLNNEEVTLIGQRSRRNQQVGRCEITRVVMHNINDARDGDGIAEVIQIANANGCHDRVAHVCARRSIRSHGDFLNGSAMEVLSIGRNAENNCQ